MTDRRWQLHLFVLDTTVYELIWWSNSVWTYLMV